MSLLTPARFFTGLTLLVLLGGCAPSTSIVATWHDPEVKLVEGHYRKILVICMLQDEATRRTGENHMELFMRGHGVASYKYFGNHLEALQDSGMTAQLFDDGYDGLVIMRLVDKDKEQTYVPGASYPTYYYDPWSYYGYSYGYYSTPGYVQTTVKYYVETNLYSTRRKGLIWTSTTTTVDPEDLVTTVDDIMQVVHDRMVSDGFLVPPPPTN